MIRCRLQPKKSNNSSNLKYGAETNLRPPGAASPTGNTIYGASRTCKKLRGQRLLEAEIQSPEKSPVGWVNMRAYNFLAFGPKFTNFISPIGDEMLLIKYFSDFRCVDPFRRYLRSKSKVVTNSAEFWTFFILPNFVGGTTCKISVHVITPAMIHIPW